MQKALFQGRTAFMLIPGRIYLGCTTPNPSEVKRRSKSIWLCALRPSFLVHSWCTNLVRLTVADNPCLWPMSNQSAFISVFSYYKFVFIKCDTMIFKQCNVQLIIGRSSCLFVFFNTFTMESAKFLPRDDDVCMMQAQAIKVAFTNQGNSLLAHKSTQTQPTDWFTCWKLQVPEEVVANVLHLLWEESPRHWPTSQLRGGVWKKKQRDFSWETSDIRTTSQSQRIVESKNGINRVKD